jgi:hypothetical protein
VPPTVQYSAPLVVHLDSLADLLLLKAASFDRPDWSSFAHLPVDMNNKLSISGIGLLAAIASVFAGIAALLDPQTQTRYWILVAAILTGGATAVCAAILWVANTRVWNAICSWVRFVRRLDEAPTISRLEDKLRALSFDDKCNRLAHEIAHLPRTFVRCSNELDLGQVKPEVAAEALMRAGLTRVQWMFDCLGDDTLCCIKMLEQGADGKEYFRCIHSAQPPSNHEGFSDRFRRIEGGRCFAAHVLQSGEMVIEPDLWGDRTGREGLPYTEDTKRELRRAGVIGLLQAPICVYNAATNQFEPKLVLNVFLFKANAIADSEWLQFFLQFLGNIFGAVIQFTLSNPSLSVDYKAVIDDDPRNESN